MAALFAEREQWKESLRECRAALGIDPGLIGARKLLITSHIRQGDKKKAQTEFKRLLALSPATADKLKEWFKEQMK
jgi:hypothetical protein